jgi:hypothetical protein
MSVSHTVLGRKHSLRPETLAPLVAAGALANAASSKGQKA